MTVINDEYFYSILKRIAANRDVAIVGYVKEPENTQAYNRAGLIFALEVILEEHRKNFGTLWNPLKGRKALEHRILQKYRWPLEQIRSLTLEDSLFLLQEELNFEKLPEQAQKIIKEYRAYRGRIVFPDIREDDWDPDLFESLPKQTDW
ncbi:hypothetical protein ABUS55_09225 [Citrobacter pasteurii]|uniref:Uncharacterized protein n=1 Tax=Citrobacter pasteurii TaxID=1563222 RepID=A0A6N6JY32_9ENTR|nr:hypothetical protein [Citrobacter pasteurii]KAA1272873.1 hypothetical protein DXF85_23855 [Citrobacter pasteurii]